ncbi:hypothetical protein D1007_33916 [Hordeum vulgare]|nr:hypothetical protein D1007_33916 [Hordeum vulgare]
MVAQNQRTPGDQVFWPKVVLKKWLNLRSKDAKFNADEDDGDDGEQEENCGCDGAGAEREAGGRGIAREPGRRAVQAAAAAESETMRAQYISTKELRYGRIARHDGGAFSGSRGSWHGDELLGSRRICIGTYNAAGIEPPEGLDIAEWLGTTGGEQADMYVLGSRRWCRLTPATCSARRTSGRRWRGRRSSATRSRGRSRHARGQVQVPQPPGQSGARRLRRAVPRRHRHGNGNRRRPALQLPGPPEEYVAATPRKFGAMDGPEDEQPRAQQRALLKR